MKRILHVVTTMDYGGVETLLMTIYRSIDRTKVQFDFLCHNTCDNYFSEEIAELGGKMYMVPFMSRVGYHGYLKELYNFFRAHPEYQIVHSHVNAINGAVLSMAKKAGVSVRISHSHMATPMGENIFKNLIYSYMRSKIPQSATHFFACSKAAADYLYKNKKNNAACKVVNNAIKTLRFRFSMEARNRIREKYNLQGKFVLGNVGRFSGEKNQIFSIKIFEEYIRQNPNSTLLLIGEGKEKEELEEYVESKKLSDRVLFLGSQKDIPDFLSAMDVFLFPSTYEGLGIVAIEAQASGLQVLSSDAVPGETNITELISYYPLSDIALWLSALGDAYSNSQAMDRIQYAQKVKDKEYDIDDTAAFLQGFYLNLN